MGIATRAAKSITWTLDPTVPSDHDIIKERLLDDGGGIFTGRSVSEDKALGFVPVLAAVRVVSETVASLPLHVYQRIEPRGRREAPEHRLYRVLHSMPNPEMSSFVFRETMQTYIEAWGNAYAEIEYDTDGFPLYLWPLHPSRMSVARENGKLVYLYRPADGGQEQKLKRRNVFHIPGMGWNGVVGFSPIQMARQAIALGLAAEEMAGRYYSNDARPGVVLKHPNELSEGAAKRLAESFDATHSGLSNKHRTAVLEEGMDITTVGFPAEDSQLIEQQKWSVSQTCRIFNLSPHMLHDLERSTFNNIEESNLNVSTFQFTPRVRRWEDQIKLQLLVDDVQHYAKFNIDGLQRGRLLDRMQAYWQRFQMGSMSPNDIAEKEDDNPIPGGDVYYVASNLTAVGGADAPAPVMPATEPALPELPPLQLMTGTRSAKAADPSVTERFRPLVERLTAQMVEFEREQVMAEARRRFAGAAA